MGTTPVLFSIFGRHFCDIIIHAPFIHALTDLTMPISSRKHSLMFSVHLGFLILLRIQMNEQIKKYCAYQILVSRDQVLPCVQRVDFPTSNVCPAHCA